MVGTATQRSWPFWPYWIFGGMMLVGALFYLSGQSRAVAIVDTGTPAEDLAGSQPGPAFTGLWRHTANSSEAPGLMMITHKGFSHRGYMRPPTENKPPSVRIGVVVTCDSLGSAPTTSDLRDEFLSFLRRPPVWNLIKSLTYIGDDLAWRSYASNGRLNNEAVLTSSEDQEEAPVASAMMILNEHGMPKYGHDPRVAELVLHIEPRGTDGQSAPPADFQAWHDSLVRALAVPGAFAHFLSQEASVATYDHPPAQLGVQFDAYRSISELIDPGDLRPVTGSWSSSSFLGYMIAEPAGKQATEAVIDLLICVCDHALHLQNGYEARLAKLQHGLG